MSKKKKQQVDKFPLVYADIEISFSEGKKPFIGQICILNDKGDELITKYYEDPRDVETKDMEEILSILYKHFIVCCDPTEDRKVLRHDARRCGIKMKPSQLRYFDVQQIERQITKAKDSHRTALNKLAAKYKIKPPVKFHDSYSDAVVIKGVFEGQLKKLDLTKDNLHKLVVV